MTLKGSLTPLVYHILYLCGLEYDIPSPCTKAAFSVNCLNPGIQRSAPARRSNSIRSRLPSCSIEERKNSYTAPNFSTFIIPTLMCAVVVATFAKYYAILSISSTTRFHRVSMVGVRTLSPCDIHQFACRKWHNQ